MENVIDKKSYPNGWDKRKLFVDIDGNVYKFGQLRPEEQGMFDTTVISKGGVQVYPVLNNDEYGLDPIEKPTIENSEDVEPESETPPEKKSIVKKAAPVEETVTIPASQLSDLMSRLNRLEDSLSRAGNVQTQVIVKEEKPRFGEMNTKDIDPSDFSSVKVKYYMFGRGYSMGSYVTREGRVMISPYNVSLYFKKEFDDVRPSDGTTKVIPFCKYETHSKKEMAFIEGHPLYGILIFSRMENAIESTSNDNIVKLESIVTRVHSLDKMQLFTLAQQHNIDINLDVNDIKNKLVWIEVKKEMDTEKSQQAIRMSDVDREMKAFKES